MSDQETESENGLKMDGKSKDVWDEKLKKLKDVLPGVLSEGEVDVEKLEKLVSEVNQETVQYKKWGFEIEGWSKDVWDERLKKLKDILPGVLSEGEVDVEKLEKLVGEENISGGEHYNFTWAGKSDAIQEIKKRTIATLKPNKEESVNFDDTENLFIEGENLEVLRTLQKSYYGKVKMIYIDPPFNTGNDFVYNDSLPLNYEKHREKTGEVDEEGEKIRGLQKNTREKGQYHSNWLSMMYPRLFLAKNLLKDDGVIFVSIDDNEVHNLKMIMNEIFGEENFISKICYVSNPNDRSKDKYVARSHEYALVYSKTPLEKGANIFKKRKSLWTEKKYHTEKGQEAFDELFDEVGDVFQSPKSIDLLKDFIQMGSSGEESEEIILDFFAGSCSTAQAIFEQNIEDCGNRKFIMVQMAEKTEEDSEAREAGFETIADIARERIRRASESIIKDNPDLDRDHHDFGFKAFKLTQSTASNFENFVHEQFTNGYIRMDARTIVDNVRGETREENMQNMLFEIMFKLGLEPNVEIVEKDSYYKISDGEYVISPVEELDDNLVDNMMRESPRVIVCLGKAFEDDLDRLFSIKVNCSRQGITIKTVPPWDYRRA